MIIALGKCPVCEKDILDKDDPKKRLPNYREFWILLSDSSRMKVGICESCREKVTKTQVDDIMGLHRDFWKKGMEEAFKKKKIDIEKQQNEQMKHYSEITSIRFAKREQELD